MVSGFLKTGFDSFRNLKGSSIKIFRTEEPCDCIW